MRLIYRFSKGKRMLPDKDFYQQFLDELNKHRVSYMIFGGFAVNLYGFSRVTEDLDIWISPSKDNLKNFGNAVVAQGFPEDDNTLKNFLTGNSIMLRLSDEGFRVDILTKLNIKKNFDEAFLSSTSVEMPYGKIYFLGYDDLIDEKIRAKRPKDLIDVDQLRKLRDK
jgi:hypothetical protein